jgi:(2Fe-2S) ferredoxin
VAPIMAHLVIEGEAFGYASIVYVVVCRGPNCRARGALPLRRRLVKLLEHEASVELIGYSCFGQCDCGPNVCFYPPGVWYGGLSRPDDADRVVRHALQIEPLHERPLDLAPEEQPHHLRNIEELVTTLERDRARRQRRRRQRRWWWPF